MQLAPLADFQSAMSDSLSLHACAKETWKLEGSQTARTSFAGLSVTETQIKTIYYDTAKAANASHLKDQICSELAARQQ